MNTIEIPPFYVGQEVVANRNHSQGQFKKGEEFKVTSVLKCNGIWSITIGNTNRRFGPCKICGMQSNEWHFYARNFSPKIEITEFISLKEIVSLELISAS